MRAAEQAGGKAMIRGGKEEARGKRQRRAPAPDESPEGPAPRGWSRCSG